jgi:hypothetical protein
MTQWAWLVVVTGIGTAPVSILTVDADAGRNTFSAIFEARLGERINAVSSSVGCDLSYAAGSTTVTGSCTVPLKSVRVDNDDTKTEHFQQWSTNKKLEPDKCNFVAQLKGVTLDEPLTAMKAVKFSGDVPFTICGRARTDGKPEHIVGTAVLMPAGEGRRSDTVKIRAQIASFNRDAYKIGPKYTEGWLSRVQQLAPVVAEEGSIELSLFAVQPAGKR